LYYLMPVVEGTSLRQRLYRDGTLPLDDALRIACEVADAVLFTATLSRRISCLKTDTPLTSQR
jgi:hypothetical protein